MFVILRGDEGGLSKLYQPVASPSNRLHKKDLQKPKSSLHTVRLFYFLISLMNKRKSYMQRSLWEKNIV